MWQDFVCFSFCSIVQKLAELLGFLVFELGLPTKIKCDES
jgi:hypothetical protein